MDTDNLNRVIRQVKRNKGAAGVDGMTIDYLEPHWKGHQREIFRKIRQRKYQPQPVLRVESSKSNGGIRLLGTPTVVDRLVQQAIGQVLTPIFDHKFSKYSHGFRPRRYAQMAILKETFHKKSPPILKVI